MEKKEALKRKVKWIILVILFVLLYIVFAVSINNKDKINSDNYLLIGNKIIWHEKDKKWYQETQVKKDLLNKDFVMMDGNKKINVSDLQYVNQQWVFFDENYKEIVNNNFRVAYSGDVSVKLANYQLELYDVNDDQYIEEVAHPESEQQFQRYRNSVNKVTFDFDGDGVAETLYTITSTSLDVVEYSLHSYMFLVKNNEVISKIKVDGSFPFGIEEILDLNDDGKFEIIVSKGVLNLYTFDSCYQIYQIVDGELVLLQNCLFND